MEQYITQVFKSNPIAVHPLETAGPSAYWTESPRFKAR